MSPNHLSDSQTRAEVLSGYAIMDTDPEEAFDELGRLAQQLCRVPFVLISFFDDRRQWNKSSLGWAIREIPLQDSICVKSLEQNRLIVHEDLAGHPEHGTNKFVQGKPGLRFCASLALAPEPDEIGGPTIAIGTISIFDTKPRKLELDQAAALKTLGRQILLLLEHRKNYLELHTQHLEAQKALKHSEAFYHSLVETLPQNIFRKDLQGRFSFANSRFCSTLKRSLPEILNKTDFDLFPPDLATKYQADDHKVLAVGKSFQTIEKHQDTDGNTLYVQVIKSPLRDAEGKVCGIQGIFWDETDRYKAEEALAYERALFRAMLDNLPDSIYFKDRQSRFIAVSRSLATRLGLKDPKEAVGKTDLDFFDRQHATHALEDEQKILASGLPVVAKTEKEHWKDGTMRWLLTTKVPLKNCVTGETMGTFGVSKDITELKETERELAMARDAALESARLKSEFLANMSHEIRTPLNAVIGMTGLLLDTHLNEEQKDFAETIRTSADSLLNVINDILDFSKIEAGKMSLEVIEFDLSETVEGTAEILAEAAQNRNLELVTFIDPKTPRHLRGDPGRIRQVLTNLLSNAVKFTEKGEVVLRVTCEFEREREAFLRFEVQDTGIGIPMEAKSRIFQAFTQADGSTTRRYGGTGLGLTICRQLVELMSGQLDFNSVPGKGSTFWFTIPLEKQTEQRYVPAMTSTLQGIRVLVVDDNDTNREIVHRQVVAWKMRNGSVSSGAEALEVLRQAARENDPYQLIILDMQMPEMDGLTLAKQIKADPEISSVQLVMLTSLGHLPEERQWRECGIGAYLIKPIKESRLYDTVITVMRGARAGGDASASISRYSGASAKPEGDYSRRSLRILVAEDNMVNQKVALRQLQKLGYSADAVANGCEVLKALAAIRYDVILMDCQMPELDGYETTRQIRRSEREENGRKPRRPQYIVAMTANALAGDREECIAAGMNDYITKPVRIEELDAALLRSMENLQEWQEAQSAGPGTVPKVPPLDQSVLEGLRELRMEGEPDPLAELVELFINDTPARIARLKKAFDLKSPHEIESAAHSLKGSAGNLGATRLASICGEIVALTRKGTVPGPEMVQKIEEEFAVVAPLLQAEKLK